MIDFYTFATSNGQRAAILLEECALPYRMHWIDLMKGEQHAAEFLKVNPAGAIPVIVDADGPGGKPLTLSQSGAIVIYLAEKAGRFIPADAVRRLIALQWLLQATTDAARASSAIFLVSTLVPEKVPGQHGILRAAMPALFAERRCAPCRSRLSCRRAVDRRLRALSGVRRPQSTRRQGG